MAQPAKILPTKMREKRVLEKLGGNANTIQIFGMSIKVIMVGLLLLH